MCKHYDCYETGVIFEEPYDGAESGFCIVENYDSAYRRLQEYRKSNPEIFGVLDENVPEKRYLGIGNKSTPDDAIGYSWRWEIDSVLPQSENEALEIMETFYSKDNCELVWIRVHGATAVIPEKYQFCGYDITYTPEIDGAYSIVNDSVSGGFFYRNSERKTKFLVYFDRLNENGLFDEFGTAFEYMKFYLSIDTSERGTFCICEIYRRTSAEM